jgi:hypothetical protein
VNEELQKELLSILRAMKDGAPVAWQELVAQRSSYCLTMGVACAALACAGIAGLWFGVRLALRGGDVPLDYYEYSSIKTMKTSAVLKVAFGLGAALAGAIALGVGVGNACFFIAEGIAPLGRMLEVLR